MINAELRHADFTAADFSYADLSHSYMGHTILEGNNLSLSKGLDTVFHFDGPSIIGVNTIYNSKGNVPKVFLRNAGVPEDIISYASKWKDSEPIRHSCFISYSTTDQDAAERLRADLQNNGVKCWFSPEDLKVGDEFWKRIYESMGRYDKLLVILSENSISSESVEIEVTLARERERTENKLVLIPIRIDDAVMKSPKPWAVSLRANRHIGDFRQWRDNDSYQSI
jgi:hypothetical protein